MTAMRIRGGPAEIIDAEARPLNILRHVIAAIPEWHHEANCKGERQEVFFPALGGSYDEARAICSECDAAVCCLAEGLQPENINHGMRGGLTPAERRAMRKTKAVT